MIEHLSKLSDAFSSKMPSISVDSVRNLRIAFIKAGKDFSKLDSSLGLIFLMDSLSAVSLIMTHIYAFIFFQPQTAGSLSTGLLVSGFLDLTRLAINCVIHGSVGEEADRLFDKLNELDITDRYNGEDIYREVMYFKSMSELKIGFTIAGIVPYSKITLLSVIINKLNLV